MRILSTLGIWSYVGLVLLLFTIGGLSDPHSSDIDCPDGWTYIHRGCYSFKKEPAKSWEDAQYYCELENGSLASLTTNAEVNKIKSNIGGYVSSIDHLYWWVGLKFVSTTSDMSWMWTNGDTYGKVPKWETASGVGEDGKCGLFHITGKVRSDNCDLRKPYICEYEQAQWTYSKVKHRAATTTSTGGTTPTTTNNAVTTTSAARANITSPVIYIPTTTETYPTTTRSNNGGGTSNTGNQGNRNTKKTSTTESVTQPIGSSTTTPTTQPTSAPPSRRPEEFNGCFAVNYESTCPPVETFGVSWPRTEANKVAHVACGTGMATWKCQKKPTCWKGEPNINPCTSAAIQDLTNQAAAIGNSSDEAVAFTETLAESTSQSETLTEQDLLQTTKLMRAAVHVTPNNKSSAEKIIKNVLKAGNSIISPRTGNTWKNMEAESKRAVASSLLNSMEDITMSMMTAINEPSVTRLQEDNMGVELQVVSVENMKGDSQSYEGETTQFNIPKQVLRHYSKGGLTKIVFISYENMDMLLQPTDAEGGNQDLVSQVMSASIGQNTGGELPEPVLFVMRTEQSNRVPKCSFWNFTQGYTGAWSQRGCFLVEYNSSHTTCKCEHLTNFAILMDVHSTELPSEHVISLTYITYIGCIISIICLFLSWLTFICLSTIQGERNSIHIHLVFCLFCAEIIFLAGVERTDHELICSIIAGFLHYFFLASFTWMFIEGVHILFMLVQVFDAAKSRMRIYYLIGYGIPLVTVGVSAGVYYQGYGTEHYCWLTTERLFIWSFAGPVAFILMVNLMILIYAMAAVCKHSEYVFSKEKSYGGNLKFVFMTPYTLQMEKRMQRHKGWIQGALALEVLLGLTWVFGYFYISAEAIPVAYLFTIFNSLQGLFIFIFHCLLNKKVRKEYKRFVEYKPQQSGTSHTNSKSGTGTGSVALASSRKHSGPFADAALVRNGSTTSA